MKTSRVPLPESNLFAHFAGTFAEWFVSWVMTQRASLSQSKVKRRLVVVFVGLLVAVASGISFGQADTSGVPQTPTTIGGPAMTPDQIVVTVVNAVDTEIGKLKNNQTLQQYGALISGFFLIALMSWSAVKALATAKGFGDMIAEWVPIFVSFGFVYLFLNRSAPAMIEGFVSALGTAISGMPMDGMTNSMKAIVDPMMLAISDLITSPTRTGDGVMETIALFPNRVINGLTTLLAVFLLVVGMVVSMATVIMSFISIALAMALAPVMVPFIMFKPTTWIFDSWLKFLAGAALMKVVFAFMVKIASAILTATAVLRSQLINDKTVGLGDFMVADLITQAMLVLLCLLAMLILMQTPGIATGLLSGSAGGGGFSGLKGLTGGTGGKAGNRAADIGAATTGRAGGAAWSGVKKGGSAAWRGISGNSPKPPPPPPPSGP